MTTRQDMLDTADAKKLHAEINQLRNQEFLISSFGLAFFGAATKPIMDDPALAIALLIVLAILFLWHYAISALRTRLGVYLEETGLSKWERHYRDFADRVTFPSQRRVATIFFAVLGILGAGLAFLPMLTSNCLPANQVTLALGVSLVAYLIFIFCLGMASYRAQRYYFQAEWKKTIAKDQGSSTKDETAARLE